MPGREEIEAELNETITQRAIRQLHESILRIEELDRQLTIANKNQRAAIVSKGRTVAG